jgi:hypothetical protein
MATELMRPGTAEPVVCLIRAAVFRPGFTVKNAMGHSDFATRPVAGDLRSFERRVCSQNGEDGIIEEILRRVGIKTRQFAEFGAGTGLECNCARRALEENWEGLFIEGDTAKFDGLCRRYVGLAGIRWGERGQEHVDSLAEDRAANEEETETRAGRQGQRLETWSGGMPAPK